MKSNPATILQAEGLSFWYDIAAVPVVYQLDEQILEGEFLAIVGESGSGKSTLLRILSGISQVHLSSGRVVGCAMAGFVKFRRTSIVAPVPEFSFVPQSFAAGLIPTQNGMRNVLVAVWEDGISKEEREAAEKLLDVAGVLDVAQLNVRKLSGGQQQRIAICRALITDPSVLFMDEPFANLDPTLKPSMGALLRTLRAERVLTVVMVTHDIEGAIRLADRIIGIKPGYGTPSYRRWQVDVASSNDEDGLRREIEDWIAR